MGETAAITEGVEVRHVFSGWAGPVLSIADHDGGMGQGPLVTVRPTHPRPRTVWCPEGKGFVATPDDWPGWKPITVTAAELEIVT
jgi:hypothetical protein